MRHTRTKRPVRQSSPRIVHSINVTVVLGGEATFQWDGRIRPSLETKYVTKRLEESLLLLKPKLNHTGVKVEVKPVFDPSSSELTLMLIISTEEKDIGKKILLRLAVDILNYVQKAYKLRKYFYPVRFDEDQDDDSFQEDDVSLDMPINIEAKPVIRRKGHIEVGFFMDNVRNLEMARIPQGTLLYRGERIKKTEDQIMVRGEGIFVAGSLSDVGLYAEQQTDVFETTMDVDLLVFSEANMRVLYNENPNSEFAGIIQRATGIESPTVSCSPLVIKNPDSMIYCPSNQEGQYVAMEFGKAIHNAGFNGWYVPPGTVTQIYTRSTHLSDTPEYLEEEALLFDIIDFLLLKDIIISKTKY